MGEDNLGALLARLPNVVRCTMRGDSLGCPWADIMSFAHVLLEFLEVAELHVMFISDLRLPVLQQLLRIPPKSLRSPRVSAMYSLARNLQAIR